MTPMLKCLRKKHCLKFTLKCIFNINYGMVDEKRVGQICGNTNIVKY